MASRKVQQIPNLISTIFNNYNATTTHTLPYLICVTVKCHASVLFVLDYNQTCSIMNFYRLQVIQKALVQVHNALCLVVCTEISVSKEKRGTLTLL